jgi:hypothetical protein
MRRRLKNIINTLMILIGSALIPWSIWMWSEIGFRFEPKFYAGNRDGSFFFVLILLGIAMISYALFDLLVLQRIKKHHKT